jgi:hypothetical protein
VSSCQASEMGKRRQGFGAVRGFAVRLGGGPARPGLVLVWELGVGGSILWLRPFFLNIHNVVSERLV